MVGGDASRNRGDRTAGHSSPDYEHCRLHSTQTLIEYVQCCFYFNANI